MAYDRRYISKTSKSCCGETFCVNCLFFHGLAELYHLVGSLAVWRFLSRARMLGGAIRVSDSDDHESRVELASRL